MKKIIIGSLLIIGLAAGISYAHGYGWGGHMMGPGYRGSHMMGHGDNYSCPGAAYFGANGWNSEGHQKFLEDTVSLRRELNDKRFAYREIQRNPEVNKDRLAALENEMIGLEKQLREKAAQY